MPAAKVLNRIYSVSIFLISIALLPTPHWSQISTPIASWPCNSDLIVPPSPQSNAYFSSVGVSGTSLVVGEGWRDQTGLPDKGAAYLYERTLGAWMLQAQLLDPGAIASANFGKGVAIDGDTVVVGAPYDLLQQSGRAYVYYRTSGIWATSPAAVLAASPGSIVDLFGTSVAISGDTILVGSPG